MSPEEAHTWSMLLHLSALSSLLVPVIGQFVAPLIIWLVKREDSRFVDRQGKEVLNFQITALLYFIVVTVLSFKFNLLAYIMFPFFALIPWIVLIIRGALAASEGIAFRYPYTLRLFR